MVTKAEELAITEQPSITEEAAREALEDLLQYRKQAATLLRTRQAAQMPIENHLALVHLETAIEGALRCFVVERKHIRELGRKGLLRREG
jgi:hypothetical protein